MIDDPVKVAIRQAQEELEERSYLPNRLVSLGMSATGASVLAGLPFFSQILTSLLNGSSRRLEERLLCVAEELEAQQRRINEEIVDKRYFESDEFYTLFGLLLERLHTTHDEEKLKLFGDALANSGSSEFKEEEKETFIRILRDLSTKDLDTLKHRHLKGWIAAHRISFGSEVLSSLSRLVAMGLVNEEFHPPSLHNTGSERLDAQALLKEVIALPPRRTFHLSLFGQRFLNFISASQ